VERLWRGFSARTAEIVSNLLTLSKMLSSTYQDFMASSYSNFFQGPTDKRLVWENTTIHTRRRREGGMVS
jgi:hypothetical protein